MSDHFGGGGGGGNLQYDLPATTDTDVYTVPTGYTARISVIFCNRNAAGRTFRLSLRRAGASPDNSQYLFYDCAIAANSTEIIRDLNIAQTDVVRAYASDADVSVNVMIDDTRKVNPSA